MEAFDYRCTTCQIKQSGYRQILDSEYFHRGFLIRKHHTENLGAEIYIICARMAEGGGDSVITAFTTYLGRQISWKNFQRGDCICHPHEDVIAASSDNLSWLKEAEEAIISSIDMLYA